HAPFTPPSTASGPTLQSTLFPTRRSSALSSVAITVTGSTNSPPVANAGPAQSVAAGSSVQLDGSGSSDPNGDPLTYQWTQTGGKTGRPSSCTPAKATFTTPATASALTFQL